MMNGKVRAFNGDMGMAMSVFKDMVGAECFIKQRASTEKAVGFIPKD